MVIESKAKPQNRMVCPRCQDKLRINYDEPECLTCGYADYAYVPPKQLEEASILSSGTKYTIRYSGEYSVLKETLCQVQLVRVRQKVRWFLACPFCNLPMKERTLSGMRRYKSEIRYSCEQGHKASLMDGSEGGELSWK